MTLYNPTVTDIESYESKMGIQPKTPSGSASIPTPSPAFSLPEGATVSKPATLPVVETVQPLTPVQPVTPVSPITPPAPITPGTTPAIPPSLR